MTVLLTASFALSTRKSLPGGKFDLKRNMVQIIHTNGQSTGLPNEDPQLHIRDFIEITNTYIPLGVSQDYVRLTLSLYSLLGDAR